MHNNSEGSARRLLLSNDAATRAAAALAVQIRKTAESDEWMEHSEVVKWIASHYEGEHGSRRSESPFARASVLASQTES